MMRRRRVKTLIRNPPAILLAKRIAVVLASLLAGQAAVLAAEAQPPSRALRLRRQQLIRNAPAASVVGIEREN
jgi:hypothetical protein